MPDMNRRGFIKLVAVAVSIATVPKQALALAWPKPKPSIPPGWLLCDGSEVCRHKYAKLFAVIGDVYGGGDGKRTFNLPDLRADVSEDPDGPVMILTAGQRGHGPCNGVKLNPIIQADGNSGTLLGRIMFWAGKQ